jgi:hypothetical protein
LQPDQLVVDLLHLTFLESIDIGAVIGCQLLRTVSVGRFDGA